LRGVSILIVFFLMFTVATILVPCPMFPGNFIAVSMGKVVNGYFAYLSAVFNGVFYGMIVWLVFVGLSRRLEQEK
jgi:hypothetical protein